MVSYAPTHRELLVPKMRRMAPCNYVLLTRRANKGSDNRSLTLTTKACISTCEYPEFYAYELRFWSKRYVLNVTDGSGCSVQAQVYVSLKDNVDSSGTYEYAIIYTM